MQPEKAISNMSCMPWIIGWLLINSKLFCLCTLKYLTRRQNHYQFYGAPVFLIALSRAVNDLPGASNQSTGSMAWREAMEHQFFFIAPSFAEHALPLLAWSRVMDNQGCSLHHLDQNFPAEGWIVSVRCQEAHMGDKPLLVPLWVCTGKRMNPFPPACNFICQYHIHPLWPWRPQKMRINQVHWVCMPIYKASQPNKDQRHSSNSIRLLGGRRNMYRPSAHSRAIL